MDISRPSNATSLTNSAVDDPELYDYPVIANGWYEFFLHLIYSTTSNAGIKIGLYLPSYYQTTGTIGFFAPNVGAFQVINMITANVTQNIATAAANGGSVMHGMFRVGAVGGMAALRWAQSTSHVDATTRKIGSTMTIRQIR